MVTGYPSVQTFTIQSAFKYDYPVEEVIKGVDQVKDIKRKAPIPVDVKETMKIIEIMEKDYIECIKLLAETINLVSHYIPSRRKRKLHIDLFGYARKSGNIKLPRAIKFCASLYSLGLPPEILGLSNLKPQHLDKISLFYDIIDQDLKDALQYYNKDNLSYFPKEIQNRVKKSLKLIEFETDEEHKKITSEVLTCLKRKDEPGVQESIVNAARIRQFLG
jgi:phosphoenolpyruvate carboxylase